MVIWSDPAKADLKSIHDFIAHDSKHYAKKVAQDIRQKTEVLDELPKIGKPVAEVSDKSIRELSMYSYRIFYQIRNDNAFVLAVVHKRRDFEGRDIGAV